MTSAPDMPPHVFANYELAQQLEAEFLTRNWHVRTQSTTARYHFSDEARRNSFWSEMAEAEANLKTPQPGRSAQQPPVLTAMGCSQDTGRRNGQSRSEDWGIVGQT